VWFGGTSPAALRRVARFDDGWHPTNLTPARYQELLPGLRMALEQEHRSLADVTLSHNMRIVLDLEAAGDDPEYIARPDAPGLFVGSPGQVVKLIHEYAQAGVTHISCSVSMKDTPGTARGRAEAMEIMAREVAPHVAGL
jgi:alkanesulfonate monooxygenase SsuD/methylene tetrahydromethanopterin reductase-like flavin-dependent oxidoreductase (luciferase family)